MALFKKASAATLALLLSASAVSASAAGIELSSRYGDADNNMSVNTQDFTAMANAIVKGTGELYDANGIYKTSAGVFNSDFNFDGKLNADDMVFLKKMFMGDKLTQLANPYAEFNKMVANFLGTEEVVVKSYVEAELKADGKTYTSKTKSDVIKNGALAEIKADSVKTGETVAQDIIIDSEGSKIYRKGETAWGVEENVTMNSSTLKSILLEVINNAQVEESANVPSLNVIEKLLLTNVSKEAFANSYSYENTKTGAKYIALPVEDVVSSSDKAVTGTAGTYIIEMDKNNNAQKISIVLGTSTYAGTTTIVENGVAEFTYAAEDVVVPTINVPVEPTPTDSTPTSTVEPSTPVTVSPSTPVTVSPSTPVTVSPSTPVSSEPTEEPSTPVSSEPTEEPSTPVTTEPSTDPDEDPSKEPASVDQTPYDVLVMAVKALADEENISVKGNTKEELVNGDVTYTNETEFNGVRKGDELQGNAKGSAVYEGDTYTYDADVYAKLNGKTSADVYVKPNSVTATVDGEVVKLVTSDSWLAKKATKDFGSIRSELTAAGREVYKNVLDKMIEDKMAEVDEAKAEAEQAQKDADKAKIDADKAQADADQLEKDIKALEEKIDNASSEDEKAEIEAEKARIEAEKTRLEAEKTRLEAEKTRLEAKKAELEAKKADFEKQQAKFEEIKADFVNEVKDQLDFTFPSLSEVKSMKADAKNRVNNNGSYFFQLDENGDVDTSKVVLSIDAAALNTAAFDKYVSSVNGTVEFTLDAVTETLPDPDELGEVLRDEEGNPVYMIKSCKPTKIKVSKDSKAVADEKYNEGVTATVNRGVINFEYPEATEITVTVDKKTDAVEYIKTNDEFTNFVSEVLASKIKID